MEESAPGRARMTTGHVGESLEPSMPFGQARTHALVPVTGARSCRGGLQACCLLLGWSWGSTRMEEFMVNKACEESQPLVPYARRTMHSRSAHLFLEPLFWTNGPRMSVGRFGSKAFCLRSRWCTEDRRPAAWRGFGEGMPSMPRKSSSRLAPWPSRLSVHVIAMWCLSTVHGGPGGVGACACTP